MDLATRAKLAGDCLAGLEATANDEEPWSFLFRTEGAVGGLFYPLSGVEDYPFDGEAGGDSPTEEELRQLAARRRPRNNSASLKRVSRFGSSHCRIGGAIAGHALFIIEGDGDPEEPPKLDGVFESVAEAKAALRAKGALMD